MISLVLQIKDTEAHRRVQFAPGPMVISTFKAGCLYVVLSPVPELFQAGRWT